jgi:inorganic pyrophosphatase/exopolyphosphatase
LLLKISQQSAALLATSILDNTLNFTGQMTTAQDVQAYAVLARLVNSSMLRKELLKLGLCAGHQGAPNTIVQ